MSMPSERAASSTLVPFCAFTSRPSILSVTSSAVTLSPDHVEHAERGNDVGDVGVLDQLRQRLHDGEARRPHAALVRPPRAVGDDVEAELAVAALGVRVDLARRHLDAVDADLEV